MSNCLSEVSASGVPRMFRPAELTSIVTGPNAFSATVNSASTSVSEPTSVCWATAFPPAASISETTAAASAASMK